MVPIYTLAIACHIFQCELGWRDENQLFLLYVPITYFQKLKKNNKMNTCVSTSHLNIKNIGRGIDVPCTLLMAASPPPQSIYYAEVYVYHSLVFIYGLTT